MGSEMNDLPSCLRICNVLLANSRHFAIEKSNEGIEIPLYNFVVEIRKPQNRLDPCKRKRGNWLLLLLLVKVLLLTHHVPNHLIHHIRVFLKVLKLRLNG